MSESAHIMQKQPPVDQELVHMVDGTARDPKEVRLCQKVRAIMQAEKLTFAKLAKQSGVKLGTVSNFIGGTYNGKPKPIMIALNNWLRTREAEERLQAKALKKPPFRETPTARRFIDTLTFAQSMSEIVVVATNPGLGKSSALKHYQQNRANVWFVHVQPYMETLPKLMNAIARALDIPPGHQARVLDMLEEKMRGCKGLLALDEAQYLNAKQLNQLRAFHEHLGVGIALFGNKHVHSNLSSKRHDVSYAQLYSRIGLKLNLEKPDPGDITTMLDAWGVEGEEERRLLRKIGNEPGALRNIDKTMKLASVAASAPGRTFDVQAIATAYKSRSETET